jgi:hypothetical protein
MNLRVPPKMGKFPLVEWLFASQGGLCSIELDGRLVSCFVSCSGHLGTLNFSDIWSHILVLLASYLGQFYILRFSLPSKLIALF